MCCGSGVGVVALAEPERSLGIPGELLYLLVWRDIQVRYKQTALGPAWAILQPILTMLVFSLFFGRLAKVLSDGVHYPVFVYTALLPWQLFAFALTESSNSLITNQNLITKVYFPRLVLRLRKQFGFIPLDTAPVLLFPRRAPVGQAVGGRRPGGPRRRD